MFTTEKIRYKSLGIICSSKFTIFLELSLNSRGQILEHISVPDGGYCLFSIPYFTDMVSDRVIFGAFSFVLAKISKKMTFITSCYPDMCSEETAYKSFYS